MLTGEYTRQAGSDSASGQSPGLPLALQRRKIMDWKFTSMDVNG